MIPGKEGLKYFGNYLLGYDRYRTNGDNLRTLYDTLQDPAKMNEFKFHAKDTMLLGDYFKLEDSRNYWKDYFKNRGIDWSDVKYPTMMSGYGLSNMSFATDIKSVLALYD